MNRLHGLAALVFLAAVSSARATPAEAMQIEKSFDLEMERWTHATLAATTPEARADALSKRPDAIAAARRMWEVIGPHLAEEWSIEPASWFLRLAPGLRSAQPGGSMKPVFGNEVAAVRKAIEAHHVRSGKLVPLCMALVATQDPRSLPLLERIQTENPDPKIQGVAALAEAMLLKTSDDSPAIMRKRLTGLRKAIIQSSDVDLGGVTVAELAEDELYVIRFLTKGRVAPDLVGYDSGGRPMKLSSFEGKVLILIFWSSTDREADRLVDMANDWVRKFANRPVAVVGVNHDPLAKLRTMEADDTVLFRNFSDPAKSLAKDYRVGTWPLVYVLGEDRSIGYAGAPGSFAELSAEALLPESSP